MNLFSDTQDMGIGNGQDQRNNQLSMDQVRQILDLPESAFLESKNSKDGKNCSQSFSEIPREIEMYPDQALDTDFPHNDLHCQKICHTDSNIMLETTLVHSEVVGCGMLKRMDHGTGCENLKYSEIGQYQYLQCI